MLAYIVRQLALAVPVLLGVSLLVFVMLSYIPGQAPEILIMQAGGSGASGEDIAELRAQLGLDVPLPVQYGRFLANALQGDLGRSIRSNRPVTDVIAEALPRTIELAVAGMALATVLGVALGIVAGVTRGSWLDSGSMIVALLGWSMPSFWLGIILLLIFSVRLNWFPITGQGGWERLVLPAVTLGLGSAGVIARLTRTEILEEMGKEYVNTARAKGLAEHVVIGRHVLKNSMISVVTVIGLQFGRLLGGTVIIETVFARQGVGRVAVDALLGRDMPVVQGAVLFLAAIFILTNVAVDLVYGFLDPRIQFE
jgi:peptide/nickel transport system permease protein